MKISVSLFTFTDTHYPALSQWDSFISSCTFTNGEFNGLVEILRIYVLAPAYVICSVLPGYLYAILWDFLPILLIPPFSWLCLLTKRKIRDTGRNGMFVNIF